MPTTPIEVNFFSVPLPEKPLPFFLRERASETKLRRGELIWMNNDESPENRNTKAVLITEGDGKGYTKEEHRTEGVGPTIMKRLLELGLIQTFRRRDYLAVSDRFSISLFNPADLIQTNAEFLTIRRGVELEVDHVTYGGPRRYGFFGVPRIRQEFSIPLTDARLAKAAQGNSVIVSIDPAKHERGTLLATEHRRKLATVEINSTAREVPIESVTVAGDRKTIDAYCESLGNPTLTREVRNAVRSASYRYKPNGQRNVHWLREQIEFVCRWLIVASHNGRVPLTWPNSAIHLALSSKPSVALERRRP